MHKKAKIVTWMLAVSIVVVFAALYLDRSLGPKSAKSVDRGDYYLLINELTVAPGAYQVDGTIVTLRDTELVSFEHRVVQENSMDKCEMTVIGRLNKFSANQNTRKVEFEWPLSHERQFNTTFRTVPDDPIRVQKAVDTVRHRWQRRSQGDSAFEDWFQSSGIREWLDETIRVEYRVNHSARAWGAHDDKSDEWLLEFEVPDHSYWVPEGARLFWQVGSMKSRMEHR